MSTPNFDIYSLKSTGEWDHDITFQGCYQLLDVIKNLGPNVTGVEIGVRSGLNTYMMLDNCENITKLWNVDPFAPFFDVFQTVTAETQEWYYNIYKNNLSVWGNRTELLKMPSTEAALHFKDQSLDFIFIDADHSFQATYDDINAWEPKVKKGGMVAGHDFRLDGVPAALKKWCEENYRDFNSINTVSNESWYWIKE